MQNIVTTTIIKPTQSRYVLIPQSLSVLIAIRGSIRTMEKKPDVRNDVGHRMYPIQKVNEAYERVVDSEVRYRFVIDVKSRRSI